MPPGLSGLGNTEKEDGRVTTSTFLPEESVAFLLIWIVKCPALSLSFVLGPYIT